MAQRTELVTDPSQSQVPIKIRDARNIVLSSADLTSVVIAAAGRAARAALVQGVIEVVLTITQVGAEIEFITFSSRIRRRLSKFHVTVDLYSREYKRAESSGYGMQFKREWMHRLEEMFYRQMADLTNDCEGRA